MESAYEMAVKRFNKAALVAKIILAVFLFLVPQQSKGFALLGPYADWMQPSNGFRVGDIGGPMNLGEEYRWNVPLVTYGFDQSFLNYFGSNGVAAVEQAFEILNDLPSATSINLSNYSLNPRLVDGVAYAEKLVDLKTTTLQMLIEQLGLAQPTRSVFVLRQFDPILTIYVDEYLWLQLPEGTISPFIFERNFDPELLVPSHSVNDSLFTGQIISSRNYADVFEALVDPTDYNTTTIADQEVQHGQFFTGLSADDVGGLRYLLHTTNINYETLLPDVQGRAANRSNYVNGAMRPGVNKITFVRQQFDSPNQQWIPVTKKFTDTYITNGQSVEQMLERVIDQPDFLFCVGDTGQGKPFSQFVSRTGTTNWQNHGVTGALGPGVIRPPIRFTFNMIPPTVWTTEYLGFINFNSVDFAHWASFDETATPPTVYPVPTFVETNSFSIRFRLSPHTFEWHPNVPIAGTVLLQTSTNLTNWSTVTTMTNTGGVIEWDHWRASSQGQHFFRVIPE